MLLIVPCDPFSQTRPDEHFAPEVREARELGHEVAFIDHDAVTAGNALDAVRRVPPADLAVYRGWMFTSAQYERLVDALDQKGARMRTDAAHYRQGHELPGWYAAFEQLTPRSVWTRRTDQDAVESLRHQLRTGPAVVRDFVKSEKHYWSEAMFIPDVGDTDAFRRVITRFLELRGERLNGGVVLRRFEQLDPPEVRTWWVDGTCALVTAHPDTPDLAPPHVNFKEVEEAVRATTLPFVTVDLMRSGGRWRVVEVGDGQVSDRPTSTDPATFLEAIL